MYLLAILIGGKKYASYEDVLISVGSMSNVSGRIWLVIVATLAMKCKLFCQLYIVGC